ncbi:15-hydroxyprostaglandin dehydrogenase [NAD(+)]-like [Haemaphysalis longicornis]
MAFKYMGRDCGYNGGHVINVASVEAVYPTSIVPAYTASKHAVLGLTRSFGSDLYFNRHGVLVNCICPSAIRTPMYHNFLDRVRAPEGGVIKDFGPFDQAVEPRNVAEGVVKLLEEAPNGAALVCRPKIGLHYFEYAVRPTAEDGEEAAAELENLYGPGRSRFLRCDVTKEKELEDCFRTTRSVFGGLDIVVNSAGVLAWPDSWKVFAVNAEAVYSSILLAFKYMGRDCGYDGGHVINLSSLAAIYPRNSCPAYIASKFAVLGLTRSFGSDLYFNRHGVRVNCMCPGAIQTPLLQNFLDRARASEGPGVGNFEPPHRPME